MGVFKNGEEVAHYLGGIFETAFKDPELSAKFKADVARAATRMLGEASEPADETQRELKALMPGSPVHGWPLTNGGDDG